MLIANAIYFHGQWEKKFDPKNTGKMVFHALSGDKDVPMMHDTRSVLYYEDNAAQAILLPYKGKSFAMLVILPRESLDNYLSEFGVGDLSRILKGMVKERVSIYLPKFEFETRALSLKRYFMDKGVKLAFSPGAADFSGIGGPPGLLFIQDVLHRAYVRIDEEGTEAAAVTVTVISIAAAPPRPKIFRADHPFLFFILDRNSDAIMFAGKVVDP
jgi:serpin B